jgi:methylmalonyl-CoA/ethylmalonyl-CoA epimerase
MDKVTFINGFKPDFTQIAYVVKDIKDAIRFFQDIIGIANFSSVIPIHACEVHGTYYSKPSDAEWLVSVAYSGGSFIELIQPVFGRSIFQDYLDKNPAGGVQHMAFTVPIADIDKVVSKLTNEGFSIITSVKMSVADIVFFDTYKEIGVITEIMGITEEGVKFVEKLKRGEV